MEEHAEVQKTQSLKFMVHLKNIRNTNSPLSGVAANAKNRGSPQGAALSLGTVEAQRGQGLSLSPSQHLALALGSSPYPLPSTPRGILAFLHPQAPAELPLLCSTSGLPS